MKLTYTLVTDGSSDRVLLPILTWSLKRHGATSIDAQFADRSRIPPQGMPNRLRTAIELYPCQVLFVHRDAESQVTLRRTEIATDLAGVAIRHIPVVPVRMTEAWLLGNHKAIRCAAGNPNGTENLGLPETRRLEDVPDPKALLYEALRIACGLNLRRRARLPLPQQVQRIPDYIDDYSELNVLSAFRLLQDDIRMLIAR